jgi:hypothetical protein
VGGLRRGRGDVDLLINDLVNRYALNCIIYQIDRGTRIYFNKALMNILQSIVLPYIIPSMKYKLGSAPLIFFAEQISLNGCVAARVFKGPGSARHKITIFKTYYLSMLF